MEVTNTKLQVQFVDLTAQYASIEEEVNAAISRVLHKADFILGDDVRAFEEEFAAYCTTKYSVGLDSGTSALELDRKSTRLNSSHT